jgi:RNA polymerase sigma factor (sigma-70 family)
MDQEVAIEPPSAIDTLAVHEALERFERLEPEKAKLVKLRYFAGFSIDESADLLGISRATAKRQWAFAKAWLFAQLRDGTGEPENERKDEPPQPKNSH